MLVGCLHGAIVLYVRQVVEYHGTMTAKLCRNEDDVDIIDELDNEHK